MKDSIDYIDIIDVKTKLITEVKSKLFFTENELDTNDYYYHLGRLAILKELREIAVQDCEEHHSEIAGQLLKVRRVVNKM